MSSYPLTVTFFGTAQIFGGDRDMDRLQTKSGVAAVARANPSTTCDYEARLKLGCFVEMDLYVGVSYTTPLVSVESIAIAAMKPRCTEWRRGRNRHAPRVDLPRTSHVVPLDPEEDLCAAPEAAPTTPACSRADPAQPLVYTRRRHRSPSRAPQRPDIDSDVRSPTCTVYVVPDSPRVTRPQSSAATSPIAHSPVQSLPDDDPEEDSVVVSLGSSMPSPPAAPPIAGVQTRLQKGIKHPKIYKDGTMRYGLPVSSDGPRSLSEALGDPH